MASPLVGLGFPYVVTLTVATLKHNNPFKITLTKRNVPFQQLNFTSELLPQRKIAYFACTRPIRFPAGSVNRTKVPVGIGIFGVTTLPPLAVILAIAASRSGTPM